MKIFYTDSSLRALRTLLKLCVFVFNSSLRALRVRMLIKRNFSSSFNNIVDNVNYYMIYLLAKFSEIWDLKILWDIY